MLREVILFLIMACSGALFAKDTVLQLYRPFTENTKHPALIINAEKTGECLQQSERILREDAFRCTAEGHVYDPCFVNPFGSHEEVICPQSPWSSESIKIITPVKLNFSQFQLLDMSRTYPWAIELDNEIRCMAVDSGTFIDNLSIHYRCSDASFLVGHVQRCSTEWKMLQKKSETTTTALINKAWF